MPLVELNKVCVDSNVRGITVGITDTVGMADALFSPVSELDIKFDK